jgi:hypothetical protein
MFPRKCLELEELLPRLNLRASLAQSKDEAKNAASRPGNNM